MVDDLALIDCGSGAALRPSALQWLVDLPRTTKGAVMMTADLCSIPLALWSAISLRLGSVHHGEHAAHWLYILAAASSIAMFLRLGLYRAVLRYIAVRAVLTICAGVFCSLVLTVAADHVVFGGVVPVSAWVIYFLIAMLYVWGSRTLLRSIVDLRLQPRSRVIIYGAGDAGVSLAIALRKNPRFRPIAFVDDDPDRHRTLVAGLEVFPPEKLDELVARARARHALLALPSAPRSRRNQVVFRLLALGLRVQSVPDLSDIVAGRAAVDQVQNIDIAEVLGRDPVPPRTDLLAGCIQDKVVMVTGAGGSIGSELCRQIVRLGPRRLVLFELSELALYSIHRELSQAMEGLGSRLEVVPLLGNAHQKQRIAQVMQTYGVQTVYHAAAYKHVPIVEQNVVQGVYNNVVATFHAAEAAAEAGVETFVLVSTDKAVNPTNVMGATKRVAELVLQAMHQRGFSTKFCMVRFGNVLDSSGSVVPLFREQILRGGPVTVTHPEVMRYFMTIPEAAQLVIQAGSMAHGGEVFVLDMGEPIRIVDLARRMIGLMGLTLRDEENTQGDIAIEFTGLRPGEKLFEELLLGDNVTRTEHPMILRAREYALPWKHVRRLLDELISAAKTFDCRKAIWLLSDAVAEYLAAPELADLVATRRIELGLDADNVTELPARSRSRESERTSAPPPRRAASASERAPAIPKPPT